MSLLPSSLQSLFKQAGWRGGERVAFVARAERAELIARDILAEFSGLRVGISGPGKEQAASDVQFFSTLRPETAVVVQPWHSRVGSLAAIATAHNDHMLVFVGATGDYYVFTDPDERLYLLGSSIGEAMERLLLGLSYGSALDRDAYSSNEQ